MAWMMVDVISTTYCVSFSHDHMKSVGQFFLWMGKVGCLNIKDLLLIGNMILWILLWENQPNLT